MSAIPVYLTSHARWLLWRTKTVSDRKTGEKRTTKVPISYHTGKACDVTKPQSWTDYVAVDAALARTPGAWDGPGVALGVIEQDGEVLIGLDLDNCLNDDGAPAEWAQPFLDAMRSYGEVSPSGVGIKIPARIRLADFPAARRLLDIAEGDKDQARTRTFGVRVSGAHAPGAQLFLMNRYFTITGRHWVYSPEDVTLLTLEQIAQLGALFGPRELPAVNGKDHDADDDEAVPDDASLNDKLRAAFLRNPRLKERWEGGTQGLKDTTRSGRDMSVLAMLFTAGFTKGETRAALRQFQHGKIADEAPRYFEQMWSRTKAAPHREPEPPNDWEEQHPPASEDNRVDADAELAFWPEPVDILADSDTGAPILTEHHVPDAIWPFIKDTAERLGVATSSVALGAITSAASVISDDWKLQPKRHDDTWTEEARPWGAILGPPSILKSPVIAIVTAPVVHLEIAARKNWTDDMTRYHADVAEWKAAGSPDPKPQLPRQARYMVEDTSIEALQEVLRDDSEGKLYAPQGKVLVRRDELSEFLAAIDRYSNGKSDRGAYLRLHNGGRFSIDRIGRGSFVTNSRSGCVLGGIQPEPIQRIAAQATDDGLLQRFMFDVPAPQAAGADRAPDRNALAAYRDLFPALAALRPARSGEEGDGHDVVTLHRDAYAAREDINQLAFVMSHMPDTSKRLEAAFGKWPGLFARLCLTFHLIEIAAARSRGDIGPPVSAVSPQTAGKVQAYMRAVLAPSLLRADAVMFASQQSSHAAWIAGYILAGKLARITAREIAKDYGALRAPEQRRTLDSTMDSLALLGWLEPEVPRVPTAAPTGWRINPRVHIQFAARGEAERKRRDAVRAAIAAHVAEVRQHAANAA